ncbi:MAG: aminopeptidase [Bacteroidetes bacterium]|nr:aminopeptidase [Bacteroidota bacterium]
MKYLLVVVAFLVAYGGAGQETKETFLIKKEIKHLPVISQGSTGTCWSFATTSFLESEIIRKGLPETDLSEMYFVNYGYKNKVDKYIMYQGNNNFGQGGLSHDVIDVLRDRGMFTYEAFQGNKVEGRYSHGALMNELKTAVETINKKRRKEFDIDDIDELDAVLEEHIGIIPKKVKANGKNLNPTDFRNQMELNPDDYIELTSYSHHPFYKQFVLEVPDNWSHALYYNLPIDELIDVMKTAIDSGYSVCWDGDVSEKLFIHKNGKADLPAEQLGKVGQELRQKTFLNRTTTDDHLMHIVGLSNDSEGRTCFYTKNSWGADSNKHGGYLHMTEDYVRLKTVGIMIHKDAIPSNIKTKLNL